MDKTSSWAVGGGLLIGIGIGFFFIKEDPLAFVGSIFVGLGLGLMIATFLSRGKKQK